MDYKDRLQGCYKNRKNVTRVKKSRGSFEELGKKGVKKQKKSRGSFEKIEKE